MEEIFLQDNEPLKVDNWLGYSLGLSAAILSDSKFGTKARKKNNSVYLYKFEHSVDILISSTN